jgi:MATE family multidrug resistance protein
MDETAPLLPNAQRTQQRLNDHSPQNFPELAEENRTIGPRLVASLVIDSIPGKIDLSASRSVH